MSCRGHTKAALDFLSRTQDPFVMHPMASVPFALQCLLPFHSCAADS